MSQWIEGLLFGGVVVGSVQYFVRSFWDGRSGHHRRVEEYQQMILTLHRSNFLHTMRELEKQTELLRAIHEDNAKG